MTETEGFASEPEPVLFPDLGPRLRLTRWQPKATVDAVRLDGESDWGAIAQWCNGAVAETGEQLAGEVWSVVPAIRVWTSHGVVLATEGDWIVRGSHAFMVYEATLFADCYDPAGEES